MLGQRFRLTLEQREARRLTAETVWVLSGLRRGSPHPTVLVPSFRRRREAERGDRPRAGSLQFIVEPFGGMAESAANLQRNFLYWLKSRSRQILRPSSRNPRHDTNYSS